jgi:hypothetical protein
MHEERDFTLVDYWRVVVADAEWLCHVGLGRFFAPWDPATTREYAWHNEALVATIRALATAGVIRSERDLLMREAAAAHALPYEMDATLDDVRHRDATLREACEPPPALRIAVRKGIPVPPWPVPRFVAPPPRLRAAWKR